MECGSFNLTAYGNKLHYRTITPHFGEYDFTISQDTGLVYFGARWYDPEVGRFITEDPIKAGSNWYAYCNDNSVRYVDPIGLDVGAPGRDLGSDHDGYDSVTVTDGGNTTTVTVTTPGGSRTSTTTVYDNNLNPTQKWITNSHIVSKGWWGTEWREDSKIYASYDKNGNYITTVVMCTGNMHIQYYKDGVVCGVVDVFAPHMNVNWNAVVSGLNKTIQGGFWMGASVTGEVETWGLGTEIAAPAFIYGFVQTASGLKEIFNGFNGGQSIAEKYGDFTDYMFSRPADPTTMVQP